MKTPLALAALAFVATASAQYAGSTPVPSDLKTGFDAITISDAKEWLGYLAGPECKGRGSGQPGFQKAADFMAERLKAMGLKGGAADGGFFQDVPLVEGSLEPETSLTLAGVKASLGQQMTIVCIQEGGEKSLPVAFVTGDSAGGLDLSQVKDRLVILTAGGSGRNELMTALKKAGAYLVLESSDLITERLTFSAFGSGSENRGRLDPGAIKEMRKTLGLAEAGAGVELVDAKARLNIKGTVNRRSVPNVVAVLEGSDPALKSEWVGIGAHLDHLGVVNRSGTDVVYWGADDDGSGSTALLCTAKALTSNPVKPKRSILFMAFCGEERGLVGSRYLADNSPVPLDKMVCELQMDMVGRDAEGVQNGNPNEVEDVTKNRDTIRLVGSKRISTELHAAILDLNKHVNFQFRYDREDVYTRSDHYSFAAKGVPIAFLFDGFHPDYHQPTDTVDKINFEKLTNSAKLYYLVALRASTQAAPFKKDVSG